jgi:hypothetical protein
MFPALVSADAGNGNTDAIGASSAITERLAAMSEWITHHSTYRNLPKHAPDIVYLAPQDLHAQAAGSTSQFRASAEEAGFKALYANGIMYLRDDFSLQRDGQILFHELVHHFQWANGGATTCKGAREVEAYDLQRLYAEDIGEEPRVPSALAMIVLSAC